MTDQSAIYVRALFLPLRRVFVMTYQALDCGKTPTTTAEQLREIKKESEGLGQDEYPEVVDDHKNLDEQSKILCGINQV